MQLFLIAIGLLVSTLFPAKTEAAYTTIMGETGIKYSNSYSNCVVDFYGGIGNNGTGQCSLFVPITIESGKTLASVTLYYFDNTGSQYIQAYLSRRNLSIQTTGTSLSSMSDTTTSSSIQYYDLSGGGAVSSIDNYYLIVHLRDGTVFRGARIYYY